jgi:hypothetical protein
MIISAAERDAQSLSPCAADGPLRPYDVCHFTAFLGLHCATTSFTAVSPAGRECRLKIWRVIAEVTTQRIGSSFTDRRHIIMITRESSLDISM